MTRLFIPEVDISKLTEGSYESLICKIESAINASAAKLLGLTETVQVAGTFKGYAIVHTESREKLFRVKYESSDRGEIVPVSAEQIEVRAYTPNQYVETQAKAFVERFLNGAKTEAGENLRRIIPLVSKLEHVASIPTAEVTPAEDIKALTAAERTWKKIFEDKLSSINKAVGSDLAQLSESRLKPKFRKLQDGSIVGKELEAYRDLVTSDLKYLGERIESIFANVGRAVEAYKGAIPALKTESVDPTVKMFESFSEDYLTDLTDIRNKLTQAVNVVNSVDELGKIYDLLSTDLHRFEVAGRFIEKMSGNLSKSPTEEI